MPSRVRGRIWAASPALPLGRCQPSVLRLRVDRAAAVKVLAVPTAVAGGPDARAAATGPAFLAGSRPGVPDRTVIEATVRTEQLSLELAAALGREAGAGLGAGTVRGPAKRAATVDRSGAVPPEGGLDAATRLPRPAWTPESLRIGSFAPQVDEFLANFKALCWTDRARP